MKNEMNVIAYQLIAVTLGHAVKSKLNLHWFSISSSFIIYKSLFAKWTQQYAQAIDLSVY